jgi:hypothetical protein
MKRGLLFSMVSLGVFFFFLNGFFDLAGYQLDRVYITVSTFLFTVFNGFFISRQSTRYSEIRNNLSRFDADMSILFRESTHLSHKEQEQVNTLLRDYYTSVLKEKDWAYYYFTHKSNLISSLHLTLGVYAKAGMDGIRGETIKNMLRTLDDVQLVRKTLISLKEETVPRFQQFFIYMLASLVFLAIMTLPSRDMVLASCMKSSYMVTIISVVILLKKFDNLTLFEGSLGEHSAKDVLAILDGNK